MTKRLDEDEFIQLMQSINNLNIKNSLSVEEFQKRMLEASKKLNEFYPSVKQNEPPPEPITLDLTKKKRR